MESGVNLKQVRNENTQAKNDPFDSEMETTMVELAFFSIQTMIYQSSMETLRDPELMQASLEAARASLFRVQKARIISKLKQYDSRYMKSSFAHW
jgi:hypothetical protein